MFSPRSHVRFLIPTFSPSRIFTWGRRSLSWTCSRCATPKILEKSQLHISYPVAEQLARTGIWKARVGKTKPTPSTEFHIEPEDESGAIIDESGESVEEEDAKPKKSRSRKTAKAPKISGDKARINIVSDKLCDDILSYIGTSLERHKGCDIIDLYPGAGIWSRKLHDYLEPRAHILMEPDEELYRPFLQPLLEKPGTVLVPKSGIVWRDLKSILTPEYLPHQKPIDDAFQPSSRNDTLLLTANIAFHPKKKYRSFDSIALLVYHQLLDSIRTSKLFQQYGQVRMLIWSRYDDVGGVLPKTMQRRRRNGIESELYCDWVHEVCGRDAPESIWFIRDTAIETYSTLCALRKMRAVKLRVPKGRETTAMGEAKTTSRRKTWKLPGSEPPFFSRPFTDALVELEAAHKKGELKEKSDEFKSMKTYRWRMNSQEKRFERMHELVVQYDRLVALHKSGQADPEELKKLGAEWHDSIHHCPKTFIQELNTYRDNLHYIRQDPPLLHWDRREYEPLVAQADEFFPNLECVLLDIQPKDVHPLIRQGGPNSNRAADMFELIMIGLLTQSTMPVDRVLDAVWPGAAEFIVPRWKSIWDTEHGGLPPMDSPYAKMTSRMLNARQWEELLELWMQWPFRPEFHELIGRTHDTEDRTTMGEDGGPMGMVGDS